MSTTTFATWLMTAIEKLYSWIGISGKFENFLTQITFIALIIIISIIIMKVLYWITKHAIHRLLRIKHIPFLVKMMEEKTLRKIVSIFPPIIIIAMIQVVLDSESWIYSFTSKITWIYLAVTVMISINTLLKCLGDVMMERESMHNRPMKGIIQIFQVIVGFITGIVIIAVIIDKSPAIILTGLGAFAAVLMLVFKDTILGLVAGIQLSQNDMIHIGDWVAVPSCGADGVVLDVTLNTVKIQNWDNTIVTLPPYHLISNAFTNWEGMTQSGGRRILKDYILDLDSIKPCTDEYLENMKNFDPKLKEFIEAKQKQAKEGQIANTENPAGLVNGTIDTNAGLLRAYMQMYLENHPALNKDLTLMVRTLAPNEYGLPLQIYCFSANKVWVSYESIASEIVEHFAAVMPYFNIKPYQSPSGRDFSQAVKNLPTK